MRQDHQLQKAVLEELDCDPAIDSSHVGVAARAGVVTLNGHVPTLAGKRTAEIAAGRVQGVKAVVNQIAVELPGVRQTTDELVAERAYAHLDANTSVPVERIHLSVERGVVTLRGNVAGQSQRQAAEEELRKLDGVRDIKNEILIKPEVEPHKVQQQFHEALAKSTPINADKIDVRTEGGRVTLMGTANSWHEKGLAESAAWSIPGVTEVVNKIDVV